MSANNSLVFGIPSSGKADQEIVLLRNRQNCKIALKLADVTNPSPYTVAVLNHIADKVSRKDMVLSQKDYKICVLTLEDLSRTNQQREIEDSIRSASKNILCYGATDIRRDSAALWAMSELMRDLDSGKILKADEKNTTDYLMCCLKHCHIPCGVVDARHKASLSGNAEVNKKNTDNLYLAMLQLGVTDTRNPAVQKTLNSLLAGAGVSSPEDIAEQLMALGIKRDFVMSELLKLMLKKKLGTYYPVELAWPEFPFGTGTGGLGAEATTADQITKALVGALPGLLKSTTELATKYGTAKIEAMNADAANQMKQLMVQSTGQSSDSISPDQLAAYMQQNQSATQAALDAAAKNAKVELDTAKAAQAQTMMYVGVGAGVLLLLGIVAIIATKK